MYAMPILLWSGMDHGDNIQSLDVGVFEHLKVAIQTVRELHFKFRGLINPPLMSTPLHRYEN